MIAVISNRLAPVFKKNGYFSSVIMMLTVPYYNYVIYNAHFDIKMQEQLGNELGCTGISFQTRRAWIYFEMCAFLVNIAQLSFSLCKQLKPCGGGSCCHKAVDMWLDETYDDEMEETIAEIQEIMAYLHRNSDK
jgi:hypothetical protein